MIIKDTQGVYELKVDTSRNIVYETFNGFLKDGAMERLHDDYVSKIGPLFKGKKWTKCCDFRKYRTSDLGEAGTTHLQWAKENGLVPGPIIVESAIVKMQMNRMSGDKGFLPSAVLNEKEAEEKLTEIGF